MPVAESFNALGAGNGFPSCLTKVNMLDLNGDGSNVEAKKWTTLGGTQKGQSPTDGEISLSLKNAMKIYWNLYSVSTDDDTVLLDVIGGDSLEPKDRACRSFWAKTAPSFNLTVYGSPIRMYDGDTSDEGNFVGDGVNVLAIASRFVTGAVAVRFNFSSYVASEDSDFEKSEYNSSFAGFHLVARCFSSSAAAITISGLTGTITPNDIELDPNSITYSDIGFYTYPE